MTPTEKHSWEIIRSRGHTHFIVRTLLREGITFALAVVGGLFAYDLLAHGHYEGHILPWPAIDLAFNFIILALVFGYGMGETRWRENEKNYRASNG